VDLIALSLAAAANGLDSMSPLVTQDATAPIDSAISVKTADIEQAYEEARQHGYGIVDPITTEPRGMRRFFVRAPDGTIINIAGHCE
jgi:hypothetical protein